MINYNNIKAELASRWCANRENIEKICKNECPITCQFEMNKIGIEDLTEKYFGNSSININAKSVKKYDYISVYQTNIWQYLNDLGGIFGLYLGITLTDFSIVIKISTLIWQNILYISIRIIDVLNLRIHRYLRRIIEISILISKLKWKTITTFISLPFLLFQIYILLYSYFQYSTITTYEFLPYNIINNKLSIDEFPTFTICYENLFRKIISEGHYDHEIVPFFDELDSILSNETDQFENQLFQSANSLIHFEELVLNKNPYLKDFFTYSSEILNRMKTTENLRIYFILKDNIFFYKYLFNDEVKFDLLFHNETINESRNKEMRFLVDFLVKYISFNLTQILNNDKQDKFKILSNLFFFYDLHYTCKLDMSNTSECSFVKPTLKFLSPHGHCVTYLPGTDTFKIAVNSTKLKNRLYFDGNFDKTFRHFPVYVKRTVFIHDHFTIPLNDKFNFRKIYIPDNDKDYYVEIITTVLKKSPKPYDTQCQQYSGSSQEMCLNQCYMKSYLDEYKCIPSETKYHTIYVENLNKIKFCKSNIFSGNFEKFMLDNCGKTCETPCEEYIYDNIIYVKQIKPPYDEKDIVFLITKTFYTKINMIPKILFIDLIVKIFNIMNLWHGFNLFSLLQRMTKIIEFRARKYIRIIKSYLNDIFLIFKPVIITKV